MATSALVINKLRWSGSAITLRILVAIRGCITVCGQSAGGGSIAQLLINPAARALFRRAILQSAPLGEPPHAAERVAQTGGRFLDVLGLSGAPDALARLQALPATKILAAQREVILSAAKPGAGHLPFAPMLWNALTPDAYLNAIADGSAGKEIIIGGTFEEMHGFFAADEAMTSLNQTRLANLVTAATGDASTIEPYRRRRPEGRPMDWLADLLTDRRFLRPSWLLAAEIAKRGGKAWSYRFDWSPPNSSFMACHCMRNSLHIRKLGNAMARRSNARRWRRKRDGAIVEANALVLDQFRPCWRSQLP